MKQHMRLLAMGILLLTTLSFTGCVSQFPAAEAVKAPEPIMDNGGEYMCPFTQDGVVAPWCDKAINASIGATVGGMAGAYAGQKAMEQIPFVGGFLGGKVGNAMGRKIAIEASGGMEYIKKTSDMSFNSVEDLAVWMYATKSTNEHYAEVAKAVGNIYPEYNERFASAVLGAAKKE